MARPIREMFHWFSRRLGARKRWRAVYLADYTLRDIGLTRMEYLFLDMSGPTGAHSVEGADQGKRSIAYERQRQNVSFTDDILESL